MANPYAADTLGHQIYVSPELLEGSSHDEVLGSVQSLTFYSHPVEPLNTRFRGLHQSFARDAFVTYNIGGSASDNSNERVYDDEQATEILKNIYSETREAMLSGEWIEDPSLPLNSGIRKTDFAPLCEMTVELAYDKEYEDRKRNSWAAGWLRLGVLYRDNAEQGEGGHRPLVFMFSSRSTVHLFAFSDQHSARIHELVLQLWNRIKELRRR